MPCLYPEYWKHRHETDDDIRRINEKQNEIQLRPVFLRGFRDISQWHGQATYNLAYRMEMRRRGLGTGLPA